MANASPNIPTAASPQSPIDPNAVTWDAPAATPGQPAPLPQSPLPVDAAHGVIERPGQTPPPIAPQGAVNPNDVQWDSQPPLMVKNPETGKQEPFDYSQSPLRFLMSEDTARHVVASSLNQQGSRDAFEKGQQDAVLSFLSPSVKAHMATALQAAMGNEKWGDLADEYLREQQKNAAAHPTATSLGRASGVVQGASTGAVGAGLAGTQVAMSAAGNVARNTVIPLLKNALAPANIGKGIGIGVASYAGSRFVPEWAHKLIEHFSDH